MNTNINMNANMNIDKNNDTSKDMLEKIVKCDVFTPDYISKLMASKLKQSGNLLEPSVGTGNLLKFINKSNYSCIDAFDIKEEYTKQIPEYSNLNKYTCDFLKKGIKTSYDNIIMNPPYIKIQDLPVPYRKYIKETFEILKGGLVDIYYAFIIKCLDLLKEDGVMIAITPNSYLYNKSALEMRKYLIDNKYIHEIIDFNDKKVFPNASVYCCITIFTKHEKDSLIYNNNKIMYNNINNYSIFDTVDAQLKTLKDICKIKNGIATLRDKIYINDKKLYNEPHLQPITNGTTIKYIIYPYKECKIIPENEFKELSPLIYNYLLGNREELSRRDKGRVKYPEWYAYGRTQSLKIQNGKCIYIPCFINPNNIKESIFIKDGMLHYSCLCIVPNDENDINKIKELLIKNIEFIKRNSAKRSGGWINISSRVLYQIKLD